MANPAFIQSNTSTGSSAPLTCAFNSNVTKGNFLGVICAAAPDSVLFNSGTPFTDSIGTNYIIIIQDSTATFGAVGFYAGIAPSSGANTVSITPSSGSPTDLILNVREYSGIPNTSISTGGFKDSSWITTDSFGSANTTKTLNYMNSLVMVIMANVNSNTYTVGSTFGNFDTATHGVAALGVEDKINVQPGSTTIAMTQSSNGGRTLNYGGIRSYLPTTMNNYQQLKVPDGLSSTEKIR